MADNVDEPSNAKFFSTVFIRYKPCKNNKPTTPRPMSQHRHAHYRKGEGCEDSICGLDHTRVTHMGYRVVADSNRNLRRRRPNGRPVQHTAVLSDVEVACAKARAQTGTNRAD